MRAHGNPVGTTGRRWRVLLLLLLLLLLYIGFFCCTMPAWRGTA